MSGLFKLSEHELSEYSSSDLLQFLVHKVKLLHRIFLIFDLIMDQQFLIGGRCHFCYEECVVSVDERLILSGIVGMDGMAHFMNKC